jgi:hypothetical protein
MRHEFIRSSKTVNFNKSSFVLALTFWLLSGRKNKHGFPLVNIRLQLTARQHAS